MSILFKECPFCHKSVFRPFYLAHVTKHMQLRSDGQMNDHISLNEKNRYSGSLEGVPQAYFHPKCGVATCMPEEIIRSYLINPFLYNNHTFCCGCHKYIHQKDLFWTETEECLKDYFDRLKEDVVNRNE